MRTATFLVILTLLATGRAEAQKNGPNVTGKVMQGAIGNTARVWTDLHPGQMFLGTLTTWNADSVALGPVRRPESWQNRPLSVATGTVTLMEIQHIRTRQEGLSRGVKKGIIFGAFAGVAVGLLLNDARHDDWLPIAGGTAAAGFLANAAYGYLAPGSEWEQVLP